MSMIHRVAAAGIVATFLPLAAAAQDTPQAFTTGMIPGGHIFMPQDPPEASVFLISDAPGWGADEEKEAADLVDKGAA
ncbi:MAG: virulence factor family protein, partial [Rhizobiales bacterium]|nr:virulence factor family protein [Hyphomicrobiales bacterium]